MILNNLESVYMIMSINNTSGEEYWHKTGRGFTPFTTTNIGRAKGELTRCQKRAHNTYKLVKISAVQDVI